MRKVYILPNLFTAASLFSGMLAIFNIFNGDPVQACWLIVLSALLDVSDGAIARLTRSTSSFGLHFDSLSDLVAFGAAPAMLAFDAFDSTYPHLAAAVCGLYTVCGALRLARFNVQATREERKEFSGLPIPGAALAVTSVVWVYSANPALKDWCVQIFPELINKNPLAPILPPVMVIIAYLMVSKVPYVGFKSIHFAGRQPFEILVTIVVIACLLFMLKQRLDVVLAVGSWAYVILGATLGLLKKPQPVLEPKPAGPTHPRRSGE